MSFADLKATRKTKSYVQSSSNIPSPKISAVDASESVQSPELEQNPDGNLYKNLPPFLRIQSDETSGRGIYAKVALVPGQIILATKPHAAVLSSQHLESHCSSCFGHQTSKNLQKCTQCRVVHYCDTDCQKADWPAHKRECSALQKWAQLAPSADVSVPNDAIRCLGRIMWKKQKKGRDDPWSREIDSMQSHRQSLQPSGFELHTHLAHSLVQYLGASSAADLDEYGLSSAAELVNITSRFTTNSFAVTDPSLSALGASVSPLVALINHSCNPNAVVVFPRRTTQSKLQEPQMQVVVLRDIQPGEQVMTSYIDVILPRTVRQKELLETYNFTCKCDACSNPQHGADPRESMWCPKSCGATAPLPTEDDDLAQCIKCKAVVKTSGAVIDAVRVGQEGLDKAAALQFKDPQKSLQLTTNLIPILVSSGLLPSSHPLLSLGRLHLSLLISSSLSSPDFTQDDLDEAVRVAARCTSGLSAILPPGHPVLGIALTEYGKLLAIDEPDPRTNAQSTPSASVAFRPGLSQRDFPPSGPPRLKLAYDTLMLARNALLVGFGKESDGGQVGSEVRQMLVELEKEISVWTTGVKNVLGDTPRSSSNRQ